MHDLERVYREQAVQLRASLAARIGDVGLAEEVVHDAFTEALEHWPAHGVPPNPGGWLATTARRKAVDRLRRARVGEAKLALLAASDGPEEPDDDLLVLVFACCHPALPRESQIALTLRAVCGLTTAEIAAAHLVSEPTMAQRLTRARRAAGGLPVRMPAPDELGERLDEVLAVVYLVFNEGYLASAGRTPARRDLVPPTGSPARISTAQLPTGRTGEPAEYVRYEARLAGTPSGNLDPPISAPDFRSRALAAQAVSLARLLHRLMPTRPEVLGLLALLLLHESRVATRFDGWGRLVRLPDQDRGRWDRGLIAEATALLDRAMARHAPGPYQLQAAIAALHAEASTYERTDWRQIRLLYDRLDQLTPSPVVRLNRAVATRFAVGADAALAEVDALATQLEGYRLLHAVRAELLAALGREEEARAANERALALAGNPAERELLSGRLIHPR